MALRRWSWLAVGVVFGCGSPAEVARTPAAARATRPTPVVINAASAHTAEQGLRAADFERRGVLDRAARAWRDVFDAERDPARLLAAAELYEQTLALPSAAECYEELTPFAKFAQHANAGLARIAAIGAETYFDRETPPALTALLEQARQHVGRGELDQARRLLAEDAAARTDRDALTLLGSIHWRNGERVLAQNAWAKARSVSRLVLTGATVNALRAFHYAPVDLAFQGDALWFATADGTLLQYDPSLRAFSWLEDRLGEVEQLGPLRDTPTLLSMPSVDSRQELLNGKVTAAVSADGERVAWVNPEHVSYLAPNRVQRLESVWAFQLGQEVGGEGARSTNSASSIGLDLERLHGGGGPAFTSVAFSSAAREAERVYVGASDGKIHALSSAGKELFSFPAHTKAVTQLAVSSDGKWLASAGADGKARVWDVAERKQRKSFDVSGEARALHFFPNDDTLELAHTWDLVRYDWRTGAEQARLPSRVEFLRVAHATSKRWTAVGHYKTDSLDVYEGTNSEPFAVTTSQVPRVHAVLAADQRSFAVAAPSGVFNVELEPFSVRRWSTEYAREVAVSPNGHWLAALHEKDLRVYNRADGALVSTVAVGSFRAERLQFQSDEEVTLTSHTEARSFALRGGKSLQPSEIVSRYPLLGGELVLRGSTLKRTSPRGHVLQTIEGVSAPIAVNAARTHFAYIRQGEIVVRAASSNTENTIAFGATVEHLALSNDGTRIAVSMYPNRLLVFDVATETGREVHGATHGGLGGVSSLTFYGNDWILTSGSDGIIAVDGREDTRRGGLHLLSNGHWFSIVNREYSTFVDGDESAIDATAAFPSATPGLYWEGLRNPGSFAQLLSGKLPRDE